ncbi:hypothetical protein [Pseudomonas mediterranea]|uniref:hypothetical protein n=1 Tax=Pseudomonas mediterranea TaxID=183795 RepID=UPI001F317A77|nr:hypothetical protein [Pseudomonas mediterranea]
MKTFRQPDSCFHLNASQFARGSLEWFFLKASGYRRVHDRYVASRKRMVGDLANARLLVGQRLTILLHDQYYFNGEKCLGDIGSLSWRFGDNQAISMYLLSDGESVGADLENPEPPVAFELDASSTCSWRIENLLVGLCTPALEGKVITQVQGMLDKGWDQEVRLAAFKVTFETGDYLIYLNQGDDAVMLVNEAPQSLAGIETTLVTSLG